MNRTPVELPACFCGFGDDSTIMDILISIYLKSQCLKPFRLVEILMEDSCLSQTSNTLTEEQR